MRETFKFFISAIFWNTLGLVLTLFAVALLIGSLLFENSELAW